MFCYLFPDSFFCLYFLFILLKHNQIQIFLFFIFFWSLHHQIYLYTCQSYIYIHLFFFFKQTQPSHMMLQCSSVVDQNQCKISFFFLESLTSSILNASVFFFFLRNFLFNIYLTHFYFIFFFLSQILFLKVELSNDNKG